MRIDVTKPNGHWRFVVATMTAVSEGRLSAGRARFLVAMSEKLCDADRREPRSGLDSSLLALLNRPAETDRRDDVDGDDGVLGPAGILS